MSSRSIRLSEPGSEWRPGRDYEILERINRPRGEGERGEGAESVVFRIGKDGKQYALKMINHAIGTIDDITMSLASERRDRGEGWRVLASDRAEAQRRKEYRNTDEALQRHEQGCPSG